MSKRAALLLNPKKHRKPIRTATTIILVKKIRGGYHGGAWKVAYADFVTAMMAFFLLLWLLNVTTEEQKAGIAEYFTPSAVSQSQSGGGGVLGGRVMTEDETSRSSMPSVINLDLPPSGEAPQQDEIPPKPEEMTEAKDSGKNDLQKAQEEEMFRKVEAELRQAIEDIPELAQLANNLVIDMTPEGLRIQIVDQDSYSMFPSGSARLNTRARQLMSQIAQVVASMPNDLAVAGHTDAHRFATGSHYTNWELSSDRANASRRAMLEAGLEAARINRVMGKADTEPFIAEDPFDARNRRISIILLREAEDVPVEESSDSGENQSSGDGNWSRLPSSNIQRTTPEDFPAENAYR